MPLARPIVVPLVMAVCCLGACGGGASTATPPAAASAAGSRAVGSATPATTGTAPLPSDIEVAELVYTDRQRVPAGFYVEPARADDAYATVAHLRNTDLDATASPPHELCAADFATALDWSERTARAEPVYGDLVATDAGARAYEFTRRLRTTPARTQVARVYRCEFLDRGGVDLRAPDGAAGTFRKVDWTTDDLRALGEYLWTFTDDNNAGRAVLRSDVAPTATGATHTLLLARLVRAATATACDRVELWRIALRADRPSGALLRESALQRAFQARRDGGVVQLCP